MLGWMLIIVALEIVCVLGLLIAIRGVRSGSTTAYLCGGEDSVRGNESTREDVAAFATLLPHGTAWDKGAPAECYSYHSPRLSQNLTAPCSLVDEDSEPRGVGDWLEQEACFFYGPEWDRMSDREKENAIGFMNMYALDMALFGDADGDGLPDHPDWDPDFEDDGDGVGFGLF